MLHNYWTFLRERRVKKLIILDFGSGNTCKNDSRIVKDMIDSLGSPAQWRDRVIIKWQLFEKAGANVPLEWNIFEYAFDYAWSLGYNTTASVFDYKSLYYLLQYPIPFIKIANNESLYPLIEKTPRGIQVFRSIKESIPMSRANIQDLVCISEYPALLEEYEKEFKYLNWVSDHTVGLELYKKHKPVIWEKHYKLEDSTGLDAGCFAITMEELEKERELFLW